jgi:hypothetical protein
MPDENAPAGGVFNLMSINIAQNATMIETLDDTLPMSIYPYILVQLCR